MLVGTIPRDIEPRILGSMEWTDALSHTVNQGGPLTGHFLPVQASPGRKSIHQFPMFSVCLAWAAQ